MLMIFIMVNGYFQTGHNNNLDLFDDAFDLCFLVKTKFIHQIRNIFTSLWSSHLILFRHKLIFYSP